MPLVCSITDSSVWSEDSDTRVVWITLLAMADQEGCVWASVDGIARRANVSVDATQEALDKFQEPDPRSRSQVDEGRRVRLIERGYEIINWKAIRELISKESRKASKRKWWQENRGKESSDVEEKSSESSQSKTRTIDHSKTKQSNSPSEREGSRKRSAPKRRWTRVPESWEPNDKHRELAAELSVNLSKELDKFRDHEFAKPKRDPDAVFRTWLRNAAEFAKRNGVAPGAEDHSAQVEAWKRDPRYRQARGGR